MVEDKIKKELLAAWDALDEIAGDVDAKYTAAIDTALSRLEAENKILIHARDIATEEHIIHIRMEQDLANAKADMERLIEKIVGENNFNEHTLKAWQSWLDKARA